MIEKEDVVEHLSGGKPNPKEPEQLAQELGLRKEEWGQLAEKLRELMRAGRAAPVKGNRWDDPAQHEMVVGTLERKPRGFGFILPADESIEEDLFVPERQQAGAMNGDLVLARYTSRGEKRRRRKDLGPSGEILRVLERAHEELVGTFRPNGKHARVIPDDPDMSRDVLVPRDKCGDAEPDEKVLVKITKWPRPNKPDDNAKGEVLEVLGEEGDPDVDFLSVVLQFDIPHEFPPEAEQEARDVPKEVTAEMCEGRRDLTDLTTIAIDPETARDRDDALSLERNDEGDTLTVWVHITDVSHWVSPRSAMDREARRRGNSVYLVSDFVPMLPKEATQQALSLAEDRERLAKSVALEFDGEGNLVDTTIHRSVVSLDAEMTYAEVQEILEGLEGDTTAGSPPAEESDFGSGVFLEDEQYARTVAKWPDDITDAVAGLDKLARTLRWRRREVGSIDLDVPEYDVRVDEDGRVTAVFQTERDRSHDLVEEFMLQANQAVGRYLDDHNLPGVYRVHDAPLEEDLEAYAEFIENVMDREIDPFDRSELQKLLEEVADTNLSEAVNMELLRCMQRAQYSPEHAPHFALQFPIYCHFTSPIRRYPDLVVHQILDQHFAGTVHSSAIHWQSETPAIATECTRTEERADDAEREIVKLKLLRFLEQEEVRGEVFDAVITGVMEFGLFAQLQEYSVEGLIKVATLEDDFYEFDETNRRLVGKKHGRVFQLGQSVQVMVDRLDITKRELDLKLVD
ncbi:MAG: ribonuclease R family protein [Candidatus Brocadiia bacterium]